MLYSGYPLNILLQQTVLNKGSVHVCTLPYLIHPFITPNLIINV